MAVMLVSAIPIFAAEPTARKIVCSACNDIIPPLQGLEEVDYSDVRLRGGFWGPRLERHHRTTIPYVLDKLEEQHHMANFDIAARVIRGETAVNGNADADAATKALEGDAGNQYKKGKESPVRKLSATAPLIPTSTRHLRMPATPSGTFTTRGAPAARR